MKTVTLGFLCNKKYTHLFEIHPWKLASLLAFLCLSSIVGFSQELIEKHSYGVTSGSGNFDSVEFLARDQNLNVNLVGGIISEVLNPDLNSNQIVESANDLDQIEGFLVLYDDNWNLLHQYILGSSILCASFTSDSTIVIGGRYDTNADLDPRPGFEHFIEGPSWGNGFIGHYKLSGEPLWIKTFESNSSSRVDDVIVANNQVLVMLNCPSNANGLLFFDDDQSYLEFNYPNRGSAILSFSIQGQYLWHEEYKSETSAVGNIDLQFQNGHLYVNLIVADSAELSLSEEQSGVPLNLPYNDHLIILEYEIDSREVASYWVFATDTDGFIGGAGSNRIEINENEKLLSFSSYLSSEFYYFDNQSDQVLIIDESESQDFLANIIRINNRSEVSWVSSFNSGASISARGGIGYQSNSTIWQAMIHRGDLFSPTNQMISNSTEDFAGLVNHFYPNGQLISSNQLIPASNSATFSINDLEVLDEIVIGGFYKGNHFMEWNQESGGLGNSIGEENGFIAVYSLPEVEKSVLYNNVLSASEASEDGEVASVDFYILGELGEPVILTMLPNAQLDLGNGQGIPIEVTVSNEEESFFSLDVFAVDDELVEGDHWGVIEVYISSDDPAFDSLEDLYIQVDIEDNEPVNIAKVDQPTFQLYPNPANDQIRVDGDLINENEHYQIINSSGQIIQEGRLENQNIDTSALSEGLYFIKLRSSMMNSFIKLIE